MTYSRQYELQAGSELSVTVGGDYGISVVYANPDTEESFTLRSETDPGD